MIFINKNQGNKNQFPYAYIPEGNKNQLKSPRDVNKNHFLPLEIPILWISVQLSTDKCRLYTVFQR